MSCKARWPGRKRSQSTVSTETRSEACSDSTSHRSADPSSKKYENNVCMIYSIMCSIRTAQDVTSDSLSPRNIVPQAQDSPCTPPAHEERSWNIRRENKGFSFITPHKRKLNLTPRVHSLLVELVYIRHVPKEDVLLMKQCIGDEVSHDRIVHFCSITLNTWICIKKSELIGPLEVKNVSVTHLQHTQQLLHICSLRLQQLVHHVPVADGY